MSQPAKQAKPRIVRCLKFMLGFCLGLMLVASLASIAVGYWLHRTWQQLPSVDHLAQYSPALPLRIYSSEGVLLAEYGEERREFLPLAQIPLRMRQALLAIEDARFYEHGAVDFFGLLRATLANVVSGQHGQGASTITMQVTRGFFLTREKTVQRKLNEILLAYKMEQQYSKDKRLHTLKSICKYFGWSARCGNRRIIHTPLINTTRIVIGYTSNASSSYTPLATTTF